MSRFLEILGKVGILMVLLFQVWCSNIFPVTGAIDAKDYPVTFPTLADNDTYNSTDPIDPMTPTTNFNTVTPNSTTTIDSNVTTTTTEETEEGTTDDPETKEPDDPTTEDSTTFMTTDATTTDMSTPEMTLTPEDMTTTEEASTTEEPTTTIEDSMPTTNNTDLPTTPTQPSTSTSTQIPNTTTTPPPPPTTTTPIPTSSTPLTSTSTQISITTTIITTSSSPSPTTSLIPTITPSPGSCSPECVKTDSKGHTWRVCAGRMQVRNCNQAVVNSSGQASWTCKFNGQFETDQPDYSKCKSTWLNDMEKETGQINNTDSAIDYLTRLKEDISLDPSQPETNTSRYFGHEMETLNTILGNMVKMASNLTKDTSIFVKVANNTVRVTESLIARHEPWRQLDSISRSKLATKLLQTIEETSFLLTSKVKISSGSIILPCANNDTDTPVSGCRQSLISGEEFSVDSLAYAKTFNDLDQLTYPIRPQGQDSVIRMPPEWVDLAGGDRIECIGMYMDSSFATLIMPGQFKLGLDSEEERKKVLNGKIMSFTVAANYKNESYGEKVEYDFKENGVQILFKHDFESWGEKGWDIPKKLRDGEQPKVAQGSAQCVFWDTKNLKWSGEGCKLVSSTSSETLCECNHLTSFAILMDVHNYVGKNRGLEILTLILSPLSILCLLATIGIISMIRMAHSQRSFITLHLAVCLAIGNFLVLLMLDRDYLNLSKGMCIATGIVTHYVFLAAFGWMAFQGIHLYHMVVNVFSYSKSPFFFFKLISYGGPIVIIAITAMAGYLSGDEPYGGEIICWLNGPYIWGFMGPVLIIVVGNTVILSVSLWKSSRIRNRSIASRNRIKSLRTWIQGCFALTILLGVTWLVGFVMLAPEIPGIIAAYFFTVLNASQGIFIFTFDCILNDKVRLGISRQYGRFLPVALNTWLKASASPSSVHTTSTGAEPPRSTSRKRKDASSESSNTISNSGSSSPGFLPPVPPPRLVVTTTSPVAVPRPRPQQYTTDAISNAPETTTSSIWDGPVLEAPPTSTQQQNNDPPPPPYEEGMPHPQKGDDNNKTLVIRNSALGGEGEGFFSC